MTDKEGPDFKNGSQEDLDNVEAEAVPSPEKEELERKKKEYEELNDRFLRVAADFDNYKKRAMKEKSEAILFANEDLIKSLIEVLDNFERAIEHSQGAGEAKAIVEGVKLVHKQFIGTLEKFGVRPIEAKKGAEFDPTYHQAIEQVESSDVPAGAVYAEILKGYMLKDRLLRPALVSVSKGKKSVFGDNKTVFGFGSGQKQTDGMVDEDAN